MSAIAVDVVPQHHFTSELQAALARTAREALSPQACYNLLEPEIAPEPVPLFDSARKAIRFAVTRDGNPARPVTSRITDKSLAPSNRSLSLIDAAAQAAMIMSVVREALGEVPMASLIASASPHSVPCNCRRPCCCGRRAHTPWHDAIDVLARAAVHGARCRTPHALRAAILVKIYGQKVTLLKIADDLEFDVDTVSKYHRMIHRWLMGAPGGKHGEAVLGLEHNAWRDAESALRNQGIVG